MSDYYITQVMPTDKKSNFQINELLKKEGLRRDLNLDYTCAMFDSEQNVVATGSCFGNTLRCLAVTNEHQGEGLMNDIIIHLIEVQFSRGNTHLFLYTKCNSAPFFSSLGFYEITRVDNQLVFMENQRNGFSGFLAALTKNAPFAPRISAIVMNANPFTLGHQYLVERASSENDIVHLFIVSEDNSFIPFSIRKELVIKGTAHLNNIIYHNTGQYMISNSTFPSYFQKDSSSAMKGHALLDVMIFLKIAKALNITYRYVGEEPSSLVTGIYNNVMVSQLPKKGIECITIPRKKIDGVPISASTVRQAIKNNNLTFLKNLVPETTINYFLSEDAAPVIRRIQEAENVIHH